MMKWRDIPTKYQDRISELRAQLERDPYEVLGVPASASETEVKAAYRKQVSTYHPDKQGDFVRNYSQEVVKIINLAYAKIGEMRK